MVSIDFPEVNALDSIEYPLDQIPSNPYYIEVSYERNPMVTCSTCRYWSGSAGHKNDYTIVRGEIKPQNYLLMCAVAQPHPDKSSLKKADGILSKAEHNCRSYSPK